MFSCHRHRDCELRTGASGHCHTTSHAPQDSREHNQDNQKTVSWLPNPQSNCIIVFLGKNAICSESSQDIIDEIVKQDCKLFHCQS